MPQPPNLVCVVPMNPHQYPWVTLPQGPTSPAPLWCHPHRHRTGNPGRPGGRWLGPQRAGLRLEPPGPVRDRGLGTWTCTPSYLGRGAQGRCSRPNESYEGGYPGTNWGRDGSSTPTGAQGVSKDEGAVNTKASNLGKTIGLGKKAE